MPENKFISVNHCLKFLLFLHFMPGINTGLLLRGGGQGFSPGKYDNEPWLEPKELLIVQSPSYYCIYPVTWNFIDSPAHRQCCQLSRINRETPDFGPYLLVLRLESETSRIVCHFFKTGLSDNEISNNFCCLSYLTVNIECLLINSGMAL